VTLLLGVPVFRKYDLLTRLIESALAGSMVPDRIVVVDNGCRFDAEYLRPDGIETMIRQLRSDKGASVARGHGFSLFCLSQQTWRRVGLFAERFWSASLEDNDSKHRLLLASVPMPPKGAAAAHSVTELRHPGARLTAPGRSAPYP